MLDAVGFTSGCPAAGPREDWRRDWAREVFDAELGGPLDQAETDGFDALLCVGGLTLLIPRPVTRAGAGAGAVVGVAGRAGLMGSNPDPRGGAACAGVVVAN